MSNTKTQIEVILLNMDIPKNSQAWSILTGEAEEMRTGHDMTWKAIEDVLDERADDLYMGAY